MPGVKRVPGPGQKNLKILIDGMGDLTGKVGWFPDAKYEDGTPVAGVAMVQEYGSPKRRIPPRPFMRPTVAEQKVPWMEMIKKGSRDVVQGKTTPDRVMEAVVLTAAADVRKKISEITSPELSELTLLLRKWRTMNDGKGRPNKVSGKTLGIVWDMYKEGKLNYDGVSTKPLVDSGRLITTLVGKVE